MISLKPGVSIKKLQPQALLAAVILDGLCIRQSIPVVITAGDDGIHKANSKHYEGLAFDFRTKHISPVLRDALMKDFKAAAGVNFDILLEEAGTDNEHGHVEYDPK